MARKTWFWSFLFLLMASVIALTSIAAPALAARFTSPPIATLERPAHAQSFWPVPAFRLTDQNRQTLRQSDLLGQVWVASFIYTSCPDVCPLITRQMAALRDALAASNQLGNAVRLVSFTVDPDRDRPSVLHDYAQRFDAEDPTQWAFLTGSPDQVKTLLVDGFHLIVESNVSAVVGSEGWASDTEGDTIGDIAHSNRAMVIDRCGQVRAIHPVLDPERFQQLVVDLKAVLQESETCPRGDDPNSQ